MSLTTICCLLPKHFLAEERALQQGVEVIKPFDLRERGVVISNYFIGTPKCGPRSNFLFEEMDFQFIQLHLVVMTGRVMSGQGMVRKQVKLCFQENVASPLP